MLTLVLKVAPDNPDLTVIHRAAQAIRRGELVAFPTETVYGLAADAFNGNAVERVFEVKGRPKNNPLPVQVASVQDVFSLAVDVPASALRLMEKFWPGPLTLVLRASPHVSELITAGTGKIGIRIPNHPVALALIRSAGTPIVAPSANKSGEPPPTTAEQVLAHFDGKIEIILDAGPTEIKVSSTV
ncbi:MAG: L-threonylcarbamoyladenylate synthase, partial [Armatimonadota bacterium]|nr:L-threonylcarbamoyladenylate synthase [Armatimonadota bacterium]